MNELKNSIDNRMEKAFTALQNQYSKVRTGRASASILDNITINYYGAATPIKQLCNVSIPEPRLIVIQPYDKTTLSDIEKGISQANLGIHPQNDGNVIRLPFQALTEEKRKEIVKEVKRLAEDGKVAVRNIRRDGNDQAKKMKKDGDITEDDEKRVLSDIQDLTDKWVEKFSQACANKEKEIMEV